MTGFNFTEKINDIAIMYTLFLIVILLMYIAFYRKPTSTKESQLTTK